MAENLLDRQRKRGRSIETSYCDTVLEAWRLAVKELKTYLLIGVFRFGELRDWLLWNDQKVNRRHRVDVVDGHTLSRWRREEA